MGKHGALFQKLNILGVEIPNIWKDTSLGLPTQYNTKLYSSKWDVFFLWLGSFWTIGIKFGLDIQVS